MIVTQWLWHNDRDTMIVTQWLWRNDCDAIKPCKQKSPSTGIGASHFNWMKGQCRRFPISMSGIQIQNHLRLYFSFAFLLYAVLLKNTIAFAVGQGLKFILFSSPAGFMIFQGYRSESETFPAFRRYFGPIDAHGLDFMGGCRSLWKWSSTGWLALI